MTDYDKLAQEYGDYRRPHPEVLSFIEKDIFPNTIVLEVGCGTGNYSAAIQSDTGCVCYGVDPSEGMLSRARLLSDKVAWMSGTAEQLPFENSSIDYLFSVDVIHHVADRRRYFHEAFRVVRPRGKICTVTSSEQTIRRRLLSRYFPETVAIELQRYPPIHDLQAMMQDSGFTQLPDIVVKHKLLLSDSGAYRHKAFSALHLISDVAYQSGISRLEQDLRAGPLRIVSRSVILWGLKPASSTAAGERPAL